MRNYICVICDKEITKRQCWHHNHLGQMHWMCEVKANRAKNEPQETKEKVLTKKRI